MITLYGIKNCDSVKKARKWLEANQVDYHFHDFRSDGLTQEKIQSWVAELGWEKLINKRSTTWKELDDATKNGLNEKNIVGVIHKAPTLIKRPLLDDGKQRNVGFKPADYQTLLLG